MRKRYKIIAKRMRKTKGDKKSNKKNKKRQ
jgi:hypothetical protein